jgi:hypothetical protein
MDKAEIIRQLRIIRFSSQRARKGKHGPMLRPIARAAGLSHMALYRAVRSGRLSTAAAQALSPVLEHVTAGPEPHSALRARFVIHGLPKSIAGHSTPDRG